MEAAHYVADGGGNRAGQIDKMLNEANKQAEESKDPAAAKDVAPAK